MKIYKGNTKLGNLFYSTSFNAGIGCPTDCECFKSRKCYGMKGNFKYNSVQESYAKNFIDYTQNKEKYFYDLHEQIEEKSPFGFRWFCAGDIPDEDYFDMEMRTALKYRQITFLSFTKKYDIVNRWIEKNGLDYYDYISNNKTLLSLWENEDGTFYKCDNPYNLPVARFIPRGREARGVDFLCYGNCSKCLWYGVGCPRIQRGQAMGLLEH